MQYFIPAVSSYTKSDSEEQHAELKMAPIATTTPAPQHPHRTNGTTLKATASSFRPMGTADPSQHHAASSAEAICSENAHAAHNYHPLPIVFARALGTSVWDPEGKTTPSQGRAQLLVFASGRLLTVGRRKALLRFPERLQRSQSGSLPSRTGSSLNRASLETDAKLTSLP